MNPIRVFLHIRAVYARDHVTPRGYQAQLIARGTGTLLYASRLKPTEAEARKLAETYLAKNSRSFLLT